MNIWAHTLVKNEDRYLWYAVTSVINYVDKIILWDTGSTDNTCKIIDEILKKYPKKVEFNEVGEIDANKFSLIRQEMLDQTKADWVMLVDGDEVWWEDSIKKLTDIIWKGGDKLETIVSPSINIVGDIYHYQEESAGRYQIDNRRGHLNIRAMSLKIPGLHAEKPHGSQGYYDKDGIVVQEREKDKRIFLDSPYLHFTNVNRSIARSKDLLVPKRERKLKHEIGESFPKDFYYPEVFFRDRPEIIESPWQTSGADFKVRAFIETPLRKIKRRLWAGKAGY
jgi:glycosyltransferase involved in cell wall biosynthesis